MGVWKKPNREEVEVRNAQQGDSKTNILFKRGNTWVIGLIYEDNDDEYDD